MSIRFIAAAAAIMSVSGAAAAAGPCVDYERLRVQRDEALRERNLSKYCDALAGLIKLHPARQTDESKLRCEAAVAGSQKGWMAARAQTIAVMADTYNSQCK